MKKIGFIGVGVMGYPMAGHMQSSGYEVSVFISKNLKALHWKEEFSGKASSSIESLSEN